MSEDPIGTAEKVQEAFNDLSFLVTKVIIPGDEDEAHRVDRAAEGSCKNRDQMWKDGVAFRETAEKGIERIGKVVETYMTAAGCPDDLQKHQNEWRSIRSEAGRLQREIEERQGADNWQGDVGNKYRESLQTQMQALEELGGLASSNNMGAMQVSTTHRALWGTAEKILQDVRSELSQVPGGNFYGGDPSGVVLFVRTDAAGQMLGQVAPWFEDSITSKADWVGCMSALNDELMQAQEAGVVTKNGKWPEAGTTVNMEAGQTSTVDERGSGVRSTDVMGKDDLGSDAGHHF